MGRVCRWARRRASEHLLRHCLDKDPRQRLRDIGDARIEIEEALTTPSVDARAASVPERSNCRMARALPWVVGFGAAAIAAAAVLMPWAPRQAVPPPAPMRLTADLGADASLATAVGQNAIIGASVALSPDGGLFTFVALQSSTGTPQLYVRRLEQLQATLLTGTEGAASPFFSPDSQWIAFFAQGKLKKIPVTGGAVVTLCDAANGRGGSWGEDGTIVFTPSVAESGLFLWRVPSGGGTPEPLPTPPRRRGHPTLASGAARWQGGALHGKHRRWRIRRCVSRRATATNGRAQDRTARRVLRPISAERPSGLHARGNALCRALRYHAPGSDGATLVRARRRDDQPEHRRGAVCRIEQRHNRVPAGTEHRWSGADPIGGSRGKVDAVTRHARHLVQSCLRARRRPARDGHQRRQATGRVGLRMGGRHAVAPDARRG